MQELTTLGVDAPLPAGTPSSEAVLTRARLSDAVFVLLQMTADTFVGKCTERIESQARRGPIQVEFSPGERSIFLVSLPLGGSAS